MSDDGFKEVKQSDTWDKEEPIIGKYVRMQTDVGENNSNMYYVEVEPGKQIGVWGSSVLDNKMQQVPTGYTIKIEYLGKVEGKKGRSYHDYRVLFKAPEFEEATTEEESPKAEPKTKKNDKVEIEDLDDEDVDLSEIPF